MCAENSRYVEGDPSSNVSAMDNSNVKLAVVGNHLDFVAASAFRDRKDDNASA